MGLSFKPLGHILSAIADPFVDAEHAIFGGGTPTAAPAPRPAAQGPVQVAPSQASGVPGQPNPSMSFLLNNPPPNLTHNKNTNVTVPNRPNPVAPVIGSPKISAGNLSSIKTQNLPGSFKGMPQAANSDPIGQFINNSIVKPVTNTIAGDIVEPARSLIAGATGNQAAEQAANQRGYQDVLNSAPVLIGKGLINFGKAAGDVGPTVSGEVTNNPVATQHASQAGLKALNQSFAGPFLTAPEDVIAHNIKGAAQDARKAGFDPKQSVGSAVVKSTIGAAGLAYPDAGILGGVKGALTRSGSAMAEGAAAADSAKPNLPNPTTTEEDVQRVMQSNPLAVKEKSGGGEPLPTPPPETAGKIPQKPSQAEMDSLYNSHPQGEPTPKEGAPVNPDGTKVPPPSPNPQTYENPKTRAGDYEQPFINQSVFEHRVNKAHQEAQSALDKVNPEDRADFIHYAQGAKPISKAKDPVAMQAAVDAWRNLADIGHAAGEVTAPGKTGYKQNYFPGYYLDKEGNVRTTGTDNFADPTDTNGYRSQRAKYENRQQALNAGEKPAFEDPSQDIARYANGLKRAVGSNLVKKGIQEADRGAKGEGSRNAVLKDNTTVKVSQGGKNVLAKQGKLESNPTKGTVTLRKINRGITKALISTGAPHLLIIPRRAWGAAVAMKVGSAAGKLSKGLDDTADLPKLDNEELGIRIGSPIHSRDVNAGVSNTVKSRSVAMKLNPFTITKRIVFDHMLPTIHNWLLGQAKDYMDAKGIEYDSPEARAVGRQINAIMGYDKNTGGLFNESVFAPALIKSTLKMYGDSVRPGYGIARGGAIGEQITNQMAGFLSKSLSNQIMNNDNQYQDDKKKQSKLNQDTAGQTFVKNILNGGAVYTPFHNSRGEQVMLRPTGEYQADAARTIVGQHQNDKGGTSFSLNNPKTVVADTLQTARNIASPLIGDTYDVVKNQMFNGQHVYNPYRPLPEQIAQGATSIASSSLPINAAPFVNDQTAGHLPSWLRESIQTNKSMPDSLKAAGSSFGLNPVADATTGQGPQLAKWFGGQDTGHEYIAANSGNPSEQKVNEGLFDQYFTKAKDDQGRTIERNQQHQQGLDDLLAANPTAMKAVQLAYQKQGKGNYEPFWDLNDANLNTYLSYRSLAPGEPDKDVMTQNNPWISDVGKADSAWAATQQFSGNVTYEQGYVPYPNISDAGKAAQNAVGNIMNIPSNQRTADQKTQLNQLINSPDYQQAEQQLHTYNNQVRSNENLGQINYLPNVPTQVSDWLNKYMSADSATRKVMKSGSPGMYSSMQQALENQSLYDVEKQGSIGYLGGNPSSSLLSGAYSLGQFDISKGKDANGNSLYSLENFSQGNNGIPSYGGQQNVATTNTPIKSSGSGSSKFADKVIASEKLASQARDLNHAARATKHLIPKNHLRPKTAKVFIKGTPKVRLNKIQLPGVNRSYTPKIKLKPSSNKVRVRVK